MNFKQFLKPDWRKIVIFFILMILSIFSFFHMTLVSLPFAVVPSLWDVLASVLAPSLVVIYGFYFPYSVLIILITIIYWYLLSCFIVWIYNRIKKKK